MGHQNVKDFKVGDKVTGYYLVKSKRQKTTKAGDPFVDLDLTDRTGMINAKLWSNLRDYFDLFERDDVVMVKAVVEDYQGKKQLKIAELRPAAEQDKVDMTELIKRSSRDPETELAYLREQIQSLQNEHLRALLEIFFDDQELVSAFKKSAAARNLHHVYQGGLLEHTVKVVKLARFAAEELYAEEVDRDLVIAGAILHDVGKITELNSEAAISYTTPGYLIGHITLGSIMMREAAEKIPGFPEPLRLELDHIILSHHGEREFGSPVLPMTPEAMVVHIADNLDAKTNMVLSAIAEDQNVEEDFTQYHKALNRHFFKSRRPQGNPQPAEPEKAGKKKG